MILVDAGPLIALFDARDRDHARCVRTLQAIREPVCTTIAVLTEAFHILQPASIGSARLRDLIRSGAMPLWFFNQTAASRAFELMDTYADHPMDLADASLVVAAETLKTRRVFTLDRNDFKAYRVRRGHRNVAFEIVP
jgi:predicted nucleic acid-binding protein